MIINPISGKKLIQDSAKVISEKLVQNKIAKKVDVFYTKAQNQGYDEALKLKSGDYDCVIAVGGDGTVNEVIQGIIDAGSDIPVAILAAGTVNDFAKSIGLPREPDEFCAMIKNGRICETDLGCCNGRHFANVAAAGVLADVAYSVPTKNKNKIGRMAYYLNGAKILFKNIKKTFPLTYEYDGGSVEADSFLFVVANTTSVGGFGKIAPRALINDGKLDLLVIKKLSVPGMVPLFIKLCFGKHINSRKVLYIQSEKINITLRGGVRVPLDFDGEQVGELPAKIVCENRKVKIFVPENTRLIQND